MYQPNTFAIIRYTVINWNIQFPFLTRLWARILISQALVVFELRKFDQRRDKIEKR